jgi:hypothetical protein
MGFRRQIQVLLDHVDAEEIARSPMNIQDKALLVLGTTTCFRK